MTFYLPIQAGEATLKKSLFPVQWVAIPVASREATKSYFS